MTTLEQLRSTQEDYRWEFFKSPDEYKEYRVQTFENFLSDYNIGRNQGRYVIGELPKLDFEESLFDLALCSHFLFFYSEQLNYEFHLASVKELLRIAVEVLIFPLLDVKTVKRSVHFDPIIGELANEGFRVEFRKSAYNMQKGENKVLIIQR